MNKPPTDTATLPASAKEFTDEERSLEGIEAKAYLEMHIGQGPVLESMNRSAGVVLGTVGLERNMVRFVGQAAHVMRRARSFEAMQRQQRRMAGRVRLPVAVGEDARVVRHVEVARNRGRQSLEPPWPAPCIERHPMPAGPARMRDVGDRGERLAGRRRRGSGGRGHGVRR